MVEEEEEVDPTKIGPKLKGLSSSSLSSFSSLGWRFELRWEVDEEVGFGGAEEDFSDGFGGYAE